MSKGFLWFAQNNSDTDYTEISIELAKSIKKYNRKSEICVITDSKTQIKSSHIDIVKILENDESKEDKLKFSNEYKAFSLTPFVHTVKLEADMLFTSSTDWWWNHLCQHDMVFSINCKNYKDETIKHTPYRKLFVQNFLPNIYNGLFYFRKSQTSKKFFDISYIALLSKAPILLKPKSSSALSESRLSLTVSPEKPCTMRSKPNA